MNLIGLIEGMMNDGYWREIIIKDFKYCKILFLCIIIIIIIIVII
jgi:hypothetical protein